MQPNMLPTSSSASQSRWLAAEKSLSDDLPRLWGTLALLFAFVNALLFTYSATTPLVANDSWYFLDTFVREYFNYSLDIKDFFDKRGGGDHAQPIQKLILLFHLRQFGLDFTIEALFGVGFALVGCLLAMRLAATPPAEPAGRWRRHLSNVGYAACLGAIPLLTFSLNSPEVFTWSLVTLGFMLIGAAVAYFSAGGKAIVGQWPAWPMLPASFLLAVVLDDLALVFTLALAMIALLHGLANRDLRRTFKVVGFAIAGLLGYDLIVQPLLSPGGTATPDTASVSAGYFLTHVADGWKAIWAPFTSMFVHPLHLEHSTKLRTLSVLQVTLAATCLVLHVLFWIRLPAKLRAGHRLDMVCGALLLSFYGSTAAIVLMRVPVFGFDYLFQPRYNVAYLLGSLPIMISCASAWRSAAPWSRLERAYLAMSLLLATGITLVQWPLANSSWDRYKYLSEYNQKAAFQLGALSKAPESVTACVDILYVCQYDLATKQRLIQLLERHQLNVFNRAFQLRHRLYPDPAKVPAR